MVGAEAPAGFHPRRAAIAGGQQQAKGRAAGAFCPGLGGEVDNARWKALWKQRKVHGPEGRIAIEVVKGQAGPAATDPNRVDGLSGATLTSRGVSHLLQFWLGDKGWGPYLAKFKARGGA